MNIREQDALKHRIVTLGAEVDALRLLVLTLIGRMAIDDADQIKAFALMVEAAGDALHSAEETTLHDRTMAREIDNVSSLMRKIICVPRVPPHH